MRTAVAVALTVLLASPAAAQSFSDSLKDALKDPTTYAPAVLVYLGNHLDWKTTQPFFAAGYWEVDPELTITGKSPAPPVSYQTGEAKIRRDALPFLAVSFGHNTAAHALERWAISKYGDHRRLIRVIAICERVAFAVTVTLAYSYTNWNRWRKNERAIAALGLPH